MSEGLHSPLDPPLTLDPVFNKGNFTLVSSDNVIFNVWDYAVFQKGNIYLTNGIKTCSRIPGTNRSIGFDITSTIMRHFLNTYLLNNPPTSSKIDIETYYDLLTFCTKLNATSVLNSLQPLLPSYIKLKRADPYTIFQSAVIYEDWDIAGQAIGKQSRDYTWQRDKSVKAPMDLALGCKTGTFDLDPNGLPYHYWMELPKKVSWALVRACADSKGWKQRGERFTVLMNFVHERNRVYPKWAAMDEKISVGLGTNLDEPTDSSLVFDQVKLETQSQSPNKKLKRKHTKSSNHKKSSRVRLKSKEKGEEPLFLPGGSESPSRALDRREVERVVSDGTSDPDRDLLDGP